MSISPAESRRLVMAEANNLIYNAATDVLALEGVSRQSLVEILERCAKELRRAIDRDNPDNGDGELRDGRSW